jgi:peptide methionine sulfoxide reductase msrA/msrB
VLPTEGLRKQIMLKWNDVLNFAREGNPEPDRTVTKSDEEWRKQLTEEQYQVTRLKGTERPFSSEMCELFEPGNYACVCCGTLLFDSAGKFDSGTGWPSFNQPVKDNAIAYHEDRTHGMSRVEVTCNTCGAHQGHVFPDGPQPSGLRYCINAVSMTKVSPDTSSAKTTQLATFGGGCFWCTEAVFQELRGVIRVVSGYSGGQIKDPSYQAVCAGTTGHAEVIQVEYDPSLISYTDLLRIHFSTHNPTTLNQQGADRGTQYRSIVFFESDKEKEQAYAVRDEIAGLLEDPIVTEIERLETFYPAESYHQDYYRRNTEAGYCAAVIHPKLAKFRSSFADRLKR